ncbi:ACP S-malonyltransferase [Peptostreptococcus equinus]|uniref:Malonyl CoA-acyl carrier protein transacylase n=1 Tax=Peptostreptococcus equinus TaxID=3003601 RepID=A0ABY7JLT8_9FIRM|nr:ACP S-malonyltransferase [Peptostreptococcus sp. CBA3647]WAW14292.1 ACP S-malonyltransferase [Peptostreptococcus sp. CBA3647]
MSKICIMFPGQGTQYDGMGKEIICSKSCEFAEGKEIYNKAKKILDVDTLEKVCQANNDNLAMTRYGQIAIFLNSLSLYKIFEEKLKLYSVNYIKNNDINSIYNMDIKAMIGLSLGEYTALCASKKMNVEESISLVEKRGQIMAAAISEKSSMIAVMKTSEEKIKDLINIVKKQDSYTDKSTLSICNYNTKGQIVIGGDIKSLKSFEELSRQYSIRRIVYLDVEGAFHTKLMFDASEKFEKYLNEITFKSSEIDVYSNTNSFKYTERDDIGYMLKKHMYSPVLFEQTINNLLRDGYDTFIEIGPGKSLTSFVKKIDKNIKVFNIEKIKDIDYVVENISHKCENI